MSTYIRMNEGQMISSPVILQEKIDERYGNTVTLTQTINFLDEVIYVVDFNDKNGLSEFIDTFLNNLGMEN